MLNTLQILVTHDNQLASNLETYSFEGKSNTYIIPLLLFCDKFPFTNFSILFPYHVLKVS